MIGTFEEKDRDEKATRTCIFNTENKRKAEVGGIRVINDFLLLFFFSSKVLARYRECKREDAC